MANQDNTNTEQKEVTDAQQINQPNSNDGSGPVGSDSGTGSPADRTDVAKPSAPAPVSAPAVPAKAGTPQPQNVVQPKAPAAPAPVEQKVILSARAQALFEDLDAYIVAMDPKKPANPRAGAANQARLFRIIQAITNLQEDFRPAFVALLRKFDEHGQGDGALHPLNVFRFFPSISLGDEDRMAFRNLLNMLTKLAAPKSRRLMLGQINMAATLNNPAISEAARQRIEGFFGQ